MYGKCSFRTLEFSEIVKNSPRYILRSSNLAELPGKLDHLQMCYEIWLIFHPSKLFVSPYTLASTPFTSNMVNYLNTTDLNPVLWISDMGVSKNNATPKSSILIGFSIIFTIHFWGKPPYFWKHPYVYTMHEPP